MHSVLGEMLAMPSKTGCSFALTLLTWLQYQTTVASKIAPANLPHSVLVMPGKPAVLLTELTSDLVYPAALVPHAFSPGRDVSYAWQNRVPPCTHLAYSGAFIHQH